MATLAYSKEASEKYSKLVKAVISGGSEVVKELLNDESIGIHTLIPADGDILTSAVALAIESGNEDMIQTFLNYPQMDFDRIIGEFKIETVQWIYVLSSLDLESSWQHFNIINYALFKDNFKLAEEFIKKRKCNWTGEGIVLAAHFYLKNKGVEKFMELIAIPNVDVIRNLSIDNKRRLLDTFKYYEADFEEIFDICFPSIDEDYDFSFWDWFYQFNISREWFEKLKRKDMLKHLNTLNRHGRPIIMDVIENSLEKAKIMFEFGADMRLSETFALMFTDSDKVSQFLQMFPFTEEDFLGFLTQNSCASEALLAEILRVYPHYEQLITLENAVLNPLKAKKEINFELCVLYKDELGLKADSMLWLEILAQAGSHSSDYDYERFSSDIKALRKAYGKGFKSFLLSNKVRLMHLLIEKGCARIALKFAKEYKIKLKEMDNSVDCVSLKLLIYPQQICDDLMEEVDELVFQVPAEREHLAFLYHPDLIVSKFSLKIIENICEDFAIDMFAPHPTTGKSLLDQALKQDELDYRTGYRLLNDLEAYNIVLTEEQALAFFTKCPGCFFTALEKFSSILPETFSKLQHSEIGNLIEIALKSGARLCSSLILKNEQVFYPHMELMVAMIKEKPLLHQEFCEVIQKTDSDKYLDLLKKDSIRSIIDDEDILDSALLSETTKLLQFAIEELGISPNTLIHRHFPLKRLTWLSYSDIKGQIFDYLIEKGGVPCIEPIRCAFLDVKDSKWIDKLLEMSYELQPSTIQIIKEKLQEQAEDKYRLDYIGDSEYEIISHPRFTHHFTARDKSICLFNVIERRASYEKLVSAGADPRCAINSDGESVLHLLEKYRFPEQDFFKAFNITEEDLATKGQASYSPIEHIIELYSDDLNDCPILSLYPKLFEFEKASVAPYWQAKKESLSEENSMCGICREDYTDADEVIVGTCQHAMHFECYKQLDASKCPICHKIIFFQDSSSEDSSESQSS